MDIEGFREYCLSLPGVSEGTPFEKFSRGKFTILVFYVCGHMFCYFNIDDFSSITFARLFAVFFIKTAKKTVNGE